MNQRPSHQDNAWALLNEGLEFARVGDSGRAIEALFRAATEYERGEDFRLIPGIWEAVGELLERVDVAPESSNPGSTTGASRGASLEYRVISESTWQKHSGDRALRLAWVYQWAAQHKERGNDPDTAQKLYFKAASYWEQTEEVQKRRPHQAARMYYRAVLNHIRYFGTATAAEPKEGRKILGPIRFPVKGHSGKHTGDVDMAISKMQTLFQKLAVDMHQPAKAYKQLAMAHSSLKSALVEAGNVIEAREMERLELRAARKYHWVAGHPLKWLYYRMRTGGFVAFLCVWLALVAVVFPALYCRYGLVQLGDQPLDFIYSMLYSAECSLLLGHRFFEALAGESYVFSIVETIFSYFGLGAALWYVTKKIE